MDIDFKNIRLYRVYEDSDCLTYMNIVKYLMYYYQIDIQPKKIIERDFPDYIELIPTIEFYRNSEHFLIPGLNNIIDKLETQFKIENLRHSANSWAQKSNNLTKN